MSYQHLKSLYDTITTTPNITAHVSASNVKLGWQNEIQGYPCITIIQIGGNAVGRLGYLVASGQIAEDFGVQIDIYSRQSLKQNYDILTQLTKTMISSGYQKLTDTDIWDDKLSANRKMTRWNKYDIYNK